MLLSKEFIETYSIIGLIYSDFIEKYSLAAVVSKDFIEKYDLLALNPVTKTFTERYLIQDSAIDISNTIVQMYARDYIGR